MADQAEIAEDKSTAKTQDITVDKSTQKNQKSESIKFCPHEIAIDVYNGRYGLYANEQRASLADRKYTSEQISKIMDIVETIGR